MGFADKYLFHTSLISLFIFSVFCYSHLFTELFFLLCFNLLTYCHKFELFDILYWLLLIYDYLLDCLKMYTHCHFIFYLPLSSYTPLIPRITHHFISLCFIHLMAHIFCTIISKAQNYLYIFWKVILSQ